MIAFLLVFLLFEHREGDKELGVLVLRRFDMDYTAELLGKDL